MQGSETGCPVLVLKVWSFSCDFSFFSFFVALIGGNEQIKTLVPGIEVIGSAYEETPGRTKAVCDGETFRIGRSICTGLKCCTVSHILSTLYNFGAG